MSGPEGGGKRGGEGVEREWRGSGEGRKEGRRGRQRGGEGMGKSEGGKRREGWFSSLYMHHRWTNMHAQLTKHDVVL